MKRSEYIALGAIGLLAVATVWPRGSTDDFASDPAVSAAQGKEGFQTLAFANLAECKDSQVVTASTCEAEYGSASQTSINDAPKFEALNDCEVEYGVNQCRPATWNGASVFIPALAGVLIARSLANPGQVTSQPLYPPRTGPGTCPPAYSAADRPECTTRTSSSSSSGGGSSSGSSSSGRRYYSTGAGRVVSRVGTSVVADMVLPARTSVSRSSVTRAGSYAGYSGSSWTAGSPSRSSSVGGSYSSSSSTISRGGFGSSSSSSSWGG